MTMKERLGASLFCCGLEIADKGKFSVRSCPEENFPEWELALRNVRIFFKSYFLIASSIYSKLTLFFRSSAPFFRLSALRELSRDFPYSVTSRGSTKLSAVERRIFEATLAVVRWYSNLGSIRP
jgi:hypothetical protein